MTLTWTTVGFYELWTCFAVILFLLTCYNISNWIKVVSSTLNIPSPPSKFIFGHAWYATNQEKLKSLGDSMYNDYGGIAKIWLSVYPVILIIAPEFLQQILSGFKHTDKISLYKLMDDFLGQGLVTINGDRWRTHRKLIQPSFHLSILETFIETFHKEGVNLFDKLQKASRPVNITSHINKCILNVLNDVVLGVSSEDQEKMKADENSPFRNAKVSVLYRITKPWLLLSWIYSLTDLGKKEKQHRNSLYDFTTEVVRQRKLERSTRPPKSKEDFKGRRPLLDRMIEISENNNMFDENDIVEELCTFMLAGQESVSTATAFCLYFLAKHQEIQKRVHNELDEVFGDDERVPTMSDLRELRYLEQCVKETLRLYPSIPVLGRKLSEDITVGKFNLPAGCNVLIVPYMTHRIPEIYPDPEKFDPDRFIPEKEASRHPYAYIPFSAGPRNCIGNKFALIEMKTVIASILRRCHITLSPDHKEYTLHYRITLRASGGIWINLHPRGNTDCAT